MPGFFRHLLSYTKQSFNEEDVMKRRTKTHSRASYLKKVHLAKKVRKMSSELSKLSRHIKSL